MQQSDTWWRRKRAAGVVGNPALCPAFRVRRGSDREIGSVSGRARRATRPTPSEFRRPCGHGADIISRRRCRGASSPPASPCALPRTAVELGNTLGVGRRRRRDRQVRQGSAGRVGKQHRRARPCDQGHPARNRIQPVPASAGRSIVGDRVASCVGPSCPLMRPSRRDRGTARSAGFLSLIHQKVT